MSEFEIQNNEWRKRNTAEGREIGIEGKEKAPDAQEKKAAARERAEKVSKEVRSTKQQMQNIMANMQQVVKTIQAIRAKLQLANNSPIPSIERDQEAVNTLQKKLNSLHSEMGDLRKALIIELKKELAEQNGKIDDAQLENEASKRASSIFEELGLG